MLQNLTLTPSRPRALEFGIYRDGDNNLDASQAGVLSQARDVSATDSSVQFSVESTNANGTKRYTIADGGSSAVQRRGVDDMSSPDNLARFVARTLDNAEKSGAKQTWIDLVDHGAGDGGGLEADTYGGVMPMQSIADAIARGVKMHAQAHPEDAGRSIDGIVANQCLMSTLGFADALSHDGVKYLAASPETMISPGVPTTVAHAIAQHVDDPNAMAGAVVSDVMHTHYGVPGMGSFGPAAAFDVLDLDPAKISSMERSVRTVNDDIAALKASPDEVAAIREDARSVRGMVRFHDATPDMPWHADRPATTLYQTLASDARLDSNLRSDARAAAQSVNALVLAHDESRHFAPFDGASYRDVSGPTVHFPVNPQQVDPWAPNVSETHNRFFAATDAAAAERVVA